jgi:phage/plasmid-like protein (TIGR03299 family)
MAHSINYNEQTQKHSFFSVKEKAWHGLGQIISDYPNSAEALTYAGLGYKVEKRNLYTHYEDGNPLPDIKVPDFYATMRMDNGEVLGVVGKDYQVVQNVEAFSFFDAIVGGRDGILYETAGALGKGERIFITAKLPDYIKVGRNDCIEKYIFLTTSHDGFGSIQIAFTPVRIVCRNTLNAALDNQVNGIRIRHTASAAEKLKEAHRFLGISNQLSGELETIFNRWSRVKISDTELKRLVELAMVPNKETCEKLKVGRAEQLSANYTNIINNVLAYAFTSPTQQQETTKGTLFGAFNAVTGYFQNVRSFKDDESKFKSILYGTGQARAQKAFELCHNFAKNGANALNYN